MEDNATIKSTPQRRIGALVLNSTQVGLVLGFVVVGVIAAFGVGFIVGMWYQASEHITPYEERPAPIAEERPESQGMTFYSTLTSRETGTAAPGAPAASAPATAKPASGASEAANRPPARPVASPPPAKVGERPSPPTGWPPPASSVSPSAPAAAKRDAVAGEATNRPPARTITPPAPRTSEPTPPEKPQTVATTTPPRPSGPSYSVQVGSFRNPEQAEQLRSHLIQKGYPARVQASVLPGKGVWYRVRVGHFPDRTGADQIAHRLTVQERLSVIVADDK